MFSLYALFVEMSLTLLPIGKIFPHMSCSLADCYPLEL
nr:MAG TPA: hypothetical protein [Caudoviricetes sp.]